MIQENMATQIIVSGEMSGRNFCLTSAHTIKVIQKATNKAFELCGSAINGQKWMIVEF